MCWKKIYKTQLFTVYKLSRLQIKSLSWVNCNKYLLHVLQPSEIQADGGFQLQKRKGCSRMQLESKQGYQVEQLAIPAAYFPRDQLEH